MNKLIDGSEYRQTAAGFVLTRGKRSVYLQGTSADQIAKARKIISSNSFDRIFKAAKTMGACDRNTRCIFI